MNNPQESKALPRPECKGHEVVREDKNVRLTRLNIGCGHKKYLDCVNLDLSQLVEPDVIWDITQRPWPFEDDTFDSVYCSHLLEHLFAPLPFMEELARVCAPGAIAIFLTPYGSSDNAWEDPTHVRPYFLDSWGYFSQAAYGGADYGYRGDWTIVDRALRIVKGKGLEQLVSDLPQLLALVMTQRNLVDEMKVVLKNVKPIRTPADARESAPISFDIPRETPEPANDATTH